MVQFTTTIRKFGEQGEKTGWTHIIIPADIAQQLIPGNKKSFRVKGKLDNFPIAAIALMPMGAGDFVMPLNAAIRKGIHKKEGAMLKATLEVDTKEIMPPAELVTCLKDEPDAYEHYLSLAKSHRLYFTRWIDGAKTEQTKTKRIAQTVNALSKKFDFGMMLRSIKKENDLMK
ncbi:MAG: YdeI/OmpD-associated family protein [Panacibacter sp.]